MKKKEVFIKHLSPKDVAYLAGFVDGDGCILAQIVKREDYRYKFQIRISIIFHQKSKRNWLLMGFKDTLGGGVLRDKGDGMSELSIVGVEPVVNLIKQLRPHLRAKKVLADLTLEIADKLSKVNNKADFIEVCKLVDKVADFTDSKGRVNTSELVSATLQSIDYLK